MACNSPSVARVADRTVNGQDQINKLQTMLQNEENVNKTNFFAEIESHLASAGITDAREISYSSNIKTEYTSEFSLDKIAGVVIASLQAAKAGTDPTIPNPATSPEAIAAYCNVVNTVAEAAKSSSNAAASMSFSMNRLSPGILAFLFASSTNIQDNETFGSEAITTTAIYHRIVQSIQDFKLEGDFVAAEMDLLSYKKMIVLQAALIDDLANGKKDIDTYEKLDAQYGDIVAKLKAKLDATVVSPAKLMTAKNLTVSTDATQEYVLSAIKKLSSMGDAHKAIIERANERMANGYFAHSLETMPLV